MAAPNDIVLGVARAADATKLRSAATRLDSLSGEFGTTAAAIDAADISAWAAEVERAAANTSQPANLISSALLQGGSSRMGTIEATGTKNSAYMQFEAVLLQNMIEAMMPEDDSAVYGSGTAGSVWKSMMAEKVATEIARTGRLGIAKQIAAGEAAAHAAAPPSPKANNA
jgi:hypothetical protein